MKLEPDTWAKSAFLKLARLGAIVFLPTKNGKYLMQVERETWGGKPRETPEYRPPGGGKEPEDKSMLATMIREIDEEFAIPRRKIRKNLTFLGYEYRKPFWGNAVFILKNHGLHPGTYQASNDPDETVELKEISLDDPQYVGPNPEKLITEEAKKMGDMLKKEAEAFSVVEDADTQRLRSMFKPDFSFQDLQDRYNVMDRLYWKTLPRLASMDSWPKEWTTDLDPTGWLEWYEQYSGGRRSDDDAKQIKRWLKFRARHGAALKANPTPRRAWALLNWAINPVNLVHARDQEKLMREMNEYQKKVDLKADMKAVKGEILPESEHFEKAAEDLEEQEAVRSLNLEAAIFLKSSEIEKQIPVRTRFLTAEDLREIHRNQCIKETGISDPTKDELDAWSNKMLEAHRVKQAVKSAAAGEVIAVDGIPQSEILKYAPKKPLLDVGDLPDLPLPKTGPEAIQSALQSLDLNKLEEDARTVIRRRLRSKRPAAVKQLGFIEGLRRSGIQPQELMISKVPVIPTQFRPYAVIGDAFQAGDANDLYRDLIDTVSTHKRLQGHLGAGANEDRLNVYDAVSAVYGFGQPVNPKTRERGVSGFLKKVVGSSPKFSFPQRKLMSKNQDFVSRGVIGVDPDLGMDEIGVPEETLWKLYAPYLQRRLVRSGMNQAQAIDAIKRRTSPASKALDLELDERPVVYTRDPAWHKYNVIAGRARRIEGDAISISPLVTAGLNADFDGDSGRFYLWIEKHLDCGSGSGDTDRPMLRENSKLRLSSEVIHIANFPREGDPVTTRPGVTEYAVPPGVRVYALNRETRQHAWMDVSHFSIHEDLQLWKVVFDRKRALFTSEDKSLVCYDKGELKLTGPGDLKVNLNAEKPGKPVKWKFRKLCSPKIRKWAPSSPNLESVTASGVVGRNETQMQFELQLTRDIGTWLGMVIGDGCVNTDSQVYLYGKGDKVENRRFFEKLSCSEFLPYSGYCGESKFTSPSLGGGERERERSVISNTGWFNRWLKDQIGDGALNKRIPDFCLNANEEHLWGLFDGLISTDGSVVITNGKKKPQLVVAFYTSSVDLVEGFQTLCERLGLRCGVSDYVSKSSGNQAFICTVSTVDLKKKHTNKPITFTHPKKNQTFQDNIADVTVDGAGSTGDPVPFPEHLEQLFKDCYTSRSGFKKNTRGKTDFGSFPTFRSNGKWERGIARREIKIVQEWLGDDCDPDLKKQFDDYVKLVEDESLTWTQITSADPLQERMTGYDITVPGALTFALHDGLIVQDTVGIHVPSMPESVRDAREKLLPSKMLFSMKDPDNVLPVPKQEFLLGLFNAQARPADQVFEFPDEQSALAAVRAGRVPMHAEVKITGQKL